MGKIGATSTALTSLVNEVKGGPICRSDLQAKIENIIGDSKLPAEVLELKKAITTTFWGAFQNAPQGTAFVNACKASKILGNKGALRFAGAAIFVEVDGQSDVATEVLRALGTGCLEDPSPLEYQLTPDETAFKM